jgi:hypothetical protein
VPSKPGPVFKPQSSSPLPIGTFSSQTGAGIGKTVAGMEKKELQLYSKLTIALVHLILLEQYT